MNKTLPEVSSVEIEGARPQPWRRWLVAFDCYNASTSLVFTSAVWVIYLNAQGHGPLAIGLFETLFHVAKFVAEIPTGIFADLLGKRKSLIIYCILVAVQNLLLLIPTTPFIIVSFTIAGVAYAFRGGANEALLWDLAGYSSKGDHAGQYSKLVSRMFIVMTFCEIIGTGLGGYLGKIMMVLPFIAQAATSLLAILLLLAIPEPKVVEDHSTKRNPLRHFGKGLRAVWQAPMLLKLLLISGLIEGCWTTIHFYNQLYLKGQGFALEHIGLIVAGALVSNILFTALAPRVMRLLSERWLVPLGVVLQVASLVCMSIPDALLGLVGYLLCMQASVAFLSPALSTYINERSPEAQRATVLSLQTALFSAAMIVLFPLFGLGVSHLPYTTVYLWTLYALVGGSVVIYGGTWLLQRRRGKMSL